MKQLMLLILICFIISYAELGPVTRAGYTTYDWQLGCPISTWCRTDPIANGVHLCWLYSNFAPATDRNRRYNFYNCATHSLHWGDGTNVYTVRSGFGNMDYDPITGRAVVVTHQSISGGLRANAARDQSPGAGIFDFCPGPLASDPVISVGNNQAVHCAMVDPSTNDSLSYARIQPWCTWSTPMNICGSAPQPGNHTQAIAASKISNKVVVAWQCAEDPYPQRAFYRLSNDGGFTWNPPTQLPFPPAQGMIPSFHISSLFAMFDNQDNLHIVASLSDTGYIFPAGIWHWCPVNNPQWSCIHFYQTETIPPAGWWTGYNAIAATRPSIIQAPNTGYLYVSWEQFDILNFEPLTALSRADIWVAESPDNGLIWQRQQRITTPNTTSKRFPCVGGVDHDTLSVAYLIDSIAGFELYTQGRATYNPVVIQRIKVPLPGVGCEDISNTPINRNYIIYPNPARTYFNIRLPFSADRSEIKIFDVSGKVVKEILRSAQNDNAIRVPLNGIKNGVYFVKVGDEIVKEKLVVTK
jgi:hypothetical protein